MMDELTKLKARYLSICYQIGHLAYEGKDYSDLFEEGLRVGDRILELDPDNGLVK